MGILLKTIGRFGKNTKGAVTIDWVVITAGIVLLAGLALNSFSNGTISYAATAVSGGMAASEAALQ